MSVKQMKPFMTNVFLNGENKISDVSFCILFKSCDSTESENVNFIYISWLHKKKSSKFLIKLTLSDSVQSHD
jgi:hypothetical protein